MRCANRSLIFDGEGVLIATYDKIHLFEAALTDGESWREADIYVAGQQAVCVETPAGLLGLATCYDMRFSALFETYSRVPVDIIALPSAFTAQTGEAHWHTLLRARAIETQAFVIAAAQTGHHPDGRHTYGHSLVVDPWGRVILDLGDAVGIGFCDINCAAIFSAREQIPSLRNKVEFAPPQTEGLRR
jgi:deaminated glutathione amidase